MGEGATQGEVCVGEGEAQGEGCACACACVCEGGGGAYLVHRVHGGEIRDAEEQLRCLEGHGHVALPHLQGRERPTGRGWRAWMRVVNPPSRHVALPHLEGRTRRSRGAWM